MLIGKFFRFMLDKDMNEDFAKNFYVRQRYICAVRDLFGTEYGAYFDRDE